MTGVPGSAPGMDRPEEQTEAEVTLTGRGISVSSRVEVVHNEFISVRPSAGSARCASPAFQNSSTTSPTLTTT